MAATDQPIVQTAVDVHRPESIQARYMVRSDGARFTDLVIGNLRVTIHGPHAKTASMLVAAAGLCPEPPPVTVVESEDRGLTYEEIIGQAIGGTNAGDAVRGVGA